MASEGFTLVEMCVVLVVTGLLIDATFPALTALRAANQKNVTEVRLQTLTRATAAYVQANGCLPCPTPPGASSSGFGYVRGDTATSPAACGTCATTEGVAPFKSLGLPIQAAKDGWGRWMRMRIDPTLAKAFGVVPPFAACTSTDGCAVGSSAKGLCKAGLSALTTASPVPVVTPSAFTTEKAAVLFLSHGANGYGAYQIDTIADGDSIAQYPFPPNVLSCAAGGYEACNANTAGAVTRPAFYNADPSLSAANPFDDLLVYMDRNNLVATFGNGACQTVW